MQVDDRQIRDNLYSVRMNVREKANKAQCLQKVNPGEGYQVFIIYFPFLYRLESFQAKDRRNTVLHVDIA